MSTTGSTDATAATPLACVPGAIPATVRDTHFQLLTRLFSTAVRETRDLPDGRAYRFDADAFDDLARWITHERRCCPFLTFTLELTPGDGAIWLRLTGPAGTPAFLDAELPAHAPSPVR
ncbi:MAG TPA: hypothetical protein VFY16_02790 [Gemmatimonadaceae bacterium]|nr:hypothetical protein [Gemmatimonadaceae bacterium]